MNTPTATGTTESDVYGAGRRLSVVRRTDRSVDRLMVTTVAVGRRFATAFGRLEGRSHGGYGSERTTGRQLGRFRRLMWWMKTKRHAPGSCSRPRSLLISES